ncbi:MAG: TetR/AcrR family transcriptional regulator [Lachnospiraceae bacterium]|nr:TetR/AcrR family transcriptional regulator [Lachnospiraceae bacterium]MBP3506539.1 TetR/AcrR family transcriptional regulator [Lachnospiraceae bacterium]
MGDNFISRKDRIIASAIEIISESGLASLSTKTLAMKENMSEALIYKYFGGINEVLIEVVEYFVRFDKSIIKTVQCKDVSYVEKIHVFFETYAIYYDNYMEISAIVLNYEELLHNTGTREIIGNCIEERSRFLLKLIEDAMEAGEINHTFTASQLKCILMGVLNTQLLDRRTSIHTQTLKIEVMESIDKILMLVKK